MNGTTGVSATSQGYGSVARLFHWITVLLVLGMFPAGAIMVQEGLSRPVQDALFIFHKNVGSVLLLLVLLRLGWRAITPPPPPPAGLPGWQERVSRLVHGGLYAMLIFMAVTGYVRVGMGGFPLELADALGVPRLPRNEAIAEVASTAHFYGRFILLALILLHVAGALQHALIRRDGVLRRMWPPLRPR
jgi:cytochrome b561